MFVLKKARALCIAAAAALATALPSQAAVVDFTFSQNSWGFGVNGSVTSTLAGVSGYGFGFGGVDIGIIGGFKEGGGESKAVVSSGPATFGPLDQPSSYFGYAAEFANLGQSLFLYDIVSGYLGVVSSAGNYGYVELNWDVASKTITIVSAKYETVEGVAISTPAVSEVPLPAALPMLACALGGLGFFARRRNSV